MAVVLSGAQALTVSGDFQADVDLLGTPTNTAIYDDVATTLSLGQDPLSADVFGDPADGGGALAFAFEAEDALIAIDTNSLNPLFGGFQNVVLAWTTGIDGSGVLVSKTGAQLHSGETLSTIFAQDEIKYLYLTWDSVSKTDSNFDFFVRVAETPQQNEVPLPAALPLFLTAMGGMGLLGWRRRRATRAA